MQEQAHIDSAPEQACCDFCGETCVEFYRVEENDFTSYVCVYCY